MRPASPVRTAFLISVLSFLSLVWVFQEAAAQPLETGVPGENVMVVGPPDRPDKIADTFLRQQNEVTAAMNPNNPLQICLAFNDYRGIDVPAIGDSWVAYACTRNGGHDWNSELFPGHGADLVDDLGMGFAADPTFVAWPGALFFNYIAVDNRVDKIGANYLQRMVWRNKEDGMAAEPMGPPIPVDIGKQGRFIDKPAMIGMLASPGNGTIPYSGTLDDGTDYDEVIPAGRLIVAAAMFTNNNKKKNNGTQILRWISDDGGLTWSHWKRLAESNSINQGVALSAMGDIVCAIWRRFDDVNELNSVLFSCSFDRGDTFEPAQELAHACPFDQGTTAVTFRTNALPALTNNGQELFAMWADRGFAAQTGGPLGCATGLSRIVYSTSSDGLNWSPPQAVEDSPGLLGHQIFPATAAHNGQVVISWLDTRNDRTQSFTPFINDFFDQNGFLRRHTGDIRAAKIINNVVSPSVQVSRYRHAVFPGETEPRQAEEFHLNARMFDSGRKPFNGDYNAVAALCCKQDENENWLPAADFDPALNESIFSIGWTDNRDVRGDAWGDLADAQSPYSPPGSVETFTEPDPPQTYPFCDPNDPTDRTRDQNAYHASLLPGTLFTAPGGSKPTGTIQRVYPVYLQNNTNRDVTYLLTILDQPSDAPCPGRASFRQLPVPPFSTCPPADSPLTQLLVKVHRRSSAVRSVFISSNLSRPRVRVLAQEVNVPTGEIEQSALLFINNDPAAPDIENPDYENPDIENFDIQFVEIHNPDLENTTFIRVEAPDIENPDIENPDFENLGYEFPDFENPDIENPDYENFEIAFPDIENPDVENSTLSGGDIDNGYTDITWTMINEGNTTTGYTAQTFISGPEAETRKTQLLVTTTYAIPTSRDCIPGFLGDNQVLVNIPDPNVIGFEAPDVENEALEDVASFWLPPGTRGHITLRVYGPPINANLVGAFVNADGCNTGEEETCADLPNFLTGLPDNEAPVLSSIPLDISGVEATGPDGAVVSFTAPTADDAAEGPVPVSCDPASGAVFPLGHTSADCTATDSVGNSATASFDVEVVDTTSPDVTVPADPVTAEATGPTGAVVSYSSLVSATDIVDASPALNCTPASGSTFPLGTTSVDCTATDSTGNSTLASFDVQIDDTTAPDLTVPSAAVTAEAVDSSGAMVNFDSQVSASDLIDGSLAVSCTPASGLFGLGDTAVSCTATDLSGNSTSAGFTVSIVDTTIPALMLPADISMEATSGAGAVVNYAATAVDSVDGALLVSCAPASGSTFPLGAMPVSCSATDGAGNVAAGSFAVTIVDSTSPSLGLPGDITIEATGPDGATVEFEATAGDSVDADVSVSCTPASGSVFPLGDTPVSCTATDDFGNVDNGQFTVTVIDTLAPTLTVPADFSVASTGGGGAVVDYAGQVSATDVVDPDPVVECLPPSGSLFPNGATTVNCTATDASGNVGSASFDATVNLEFLGLFKPYAPPPKKFNAGRALVLSWAYGDGSGNKIDSSTFDPTIRINGPFDCSAGDGGDILVEEDTGSSRLRYADGDMEFNFSWETVFPGTNIELPPGCYNINIDTGQQANGPFPVQFR